MVTPYLWDANLFSCLQNQSSANKCLLKVATYAAQLEQYPKAIEIYEQVKTESFSTPGKKAFIYNRIPAVARAFSFFLSEMPRLSLHIFLLFPALTHFEKMFWNAFNFFILK